MFFAATTLFAQHFSRVPINVSVRLSCLKSFF